MIYLGLAPCGNTASVGIQTTVFRWTFWTVALALALALGLTMACGVEQEHSPLGGVLPGAELPKHPGYLRAAHPSLGKLTIFDADTFEVYRTVELPPSTVGFTHRLEIDPDGRIWIGYSEYVVDVMFGGNRRKSGVLVLSPEGDLEHELNVGCANPNGGIAFANGYAFIGCPVSGFQGRVVVIDTATLQMVKIFDRVHPPGEVPAERPFYINAVGKVADSILVVGVGPSPREYQSLTTYGAPYTRADRGMYGVFMQGHGG